MIETRHALIERVDTKANYKVTFDTGLPIYVNWLNVNGIRMGFDEGHVEISQDMEVKLSGGDADHVAGIKFLKKD